MKTAKEIEENLIQFTGTEHYYKHPFGIMITDGVKYLADSAESWWLIDIVASYQFDEKIKQEEFQVFKLSVKPDKTALVEISDGNKNVLATQDIDYTDFPLTEVELWCIQKICILPNEY